VGCLTGPFTGRYVKSPPHPRVINVDQNAAYIGDIRDLKEAGLLPEDCERRPVKYLNNIVEQDHRFIKRRVKPGLGFGAYPTAWRTLQGYEVMHMIRKGQIESVEKGNSQAQNQFIAGLFGLTA
jgi:IS6 family transposase